MSLDISKLDKTKAYVAFSHGDSWISKLIMWFTKSKFSHSFILYWDENWKQWMALGDNWNGWVYTPAKTENVLSVADVSAVGDLWVGLKKNADWLGSGYDYPALVGMIWVELGWHVFKKSWNNPLNLANYWFCSEIASHVTIDSNVPLNVVPKNTDPQRLHDGLKLVAGVNFIE